MNLVNRSLIVVVPKKPYIDWANEAYPEGPNLDIEGPQYEYSAYLIDDVEDESALAAALKRYHRMIFEHELDAWNRDPNRWPPRRDLRTFKRWFEVRLSSMLWDLCHHPLEVEEFEE